MQRLTCLSVTFGHWAVYFIGMIINVISVMYLDNNNLFNEFVFSFAVSIKMNVLLFAPALLLAYIATQGIHGTVKQLGICAAVQVIFRFSLPFLNFVSK